MPTTKYYPGPSAYGGPSSPYGPGTDPGIGTPSKGPALPDPKLDVSAKIDPALDGDSAKVRALTTARLKQCGKRAMAENPGAKGSLNVVATVGLNGHVEIVSSTATGNVAGTFQACAKSVVKTMTLAPRDAESKCVMVIKLN